jgi:hypothetical protein
MKFTRAFFGLSFLLFFVLFKGPVFCASFSDVGENHPQYAAIESLKNLGIVNGYSDGTFGPEKSVNRSEALKMILLSAEITVSDLSPDTTVSLSDVKSSDWFLKYVFSGINNGIVNGNPDGTFTPFRQVNEAEFLKMLLLSFKIDLSSHQNINKSISVDTVGTEWFLPYLSYSKTVGIITPTINDELLPGKMLTRGECAEIIYKLLVIIRGGDAQKLLSIAEANLVYVVVELNKNNIQGALDYANTAVFYTEQVLTLKPDDNIAKGANKIALGFKSLCLAYQAGVNNNPDEVANFVSQAKTFADEAVAFSDSFSSLRSEVLEIGKILLEQVK